MTKGRRFNKWHSSAGVAAIGVLAFSFGVQAGPTSPGRGGSGLAAQNGDRIQKLIDEGKLNLPEGITIERLGAEYTYAGKVYSDEAIQSGRAAAHNGVEAIVHLNDYFSGFGFFFNYQPTTGPAGLFQGAFQSENLGLGNGFSGGDLISSYSAALFRSSRDPATQLLADINFELWDGDPLALVDTAINGFSNAPIAGSAATFSGIPANFLADFQIDLATPVVAPNSTVWMTLTGSSCRLGWIISFVVPKIGSAGPDLWEVARDQTGVGTCCHDGTACDVSMAITCADDGDGSAQFCSDGEAEAQGLTFFGGPCTGDDITDSCATFFNTVRSPAKVLISAVPVSSSNAAAEGVISGGDLTLARGDTDVVIQARVSNFDPDGLGVETNAYQVVLDTSGLTSGLAGTLVGAFGRVACTTANDCITAFGGVCQLLGTPCSGPSDCEVFDSCGAETTCGMGGFCDPAWVATKRGDFLLKQDGTNTLPAVDISVPRFRMGAVVTSGPAVAARSPYPADGLYGGSMAFYVPADAKGTFTLTFEDPPNSQVLDNATANGVPLIAIVASTITIPTGQCCDIGSATPVCLDDTVTADECGALAAVTNFDTTKTCADDCIQCTNFGGSDPNCDDGDACTDDGCDLTGFCTNVLNFVDDGASCYDGSGASCDAATLDDGDDCTDDVCDGGGNRGVPSSTQSADGSMCDDANPCTHSDSCTAGACAGLDVNLEACGTSADCLAITGVEFDCVTGFCFCTIAPTFSPVVTASGNGNPSCFDAGQKVTVDLTIGAAASVINGAQFNLNYDPSCLAFNSISPAGAPYVLEIQEIVDEVAGQIFYAVGVSQFGGVGANGNAAVATASFTKIGSCNSCDICITDGLFSDDNGDAVFAENFCSGALSANTSATLSVPDSVKINADCGTATGTVTWAAPSVSTSCSGGATMNCTGINAFGGDMTAIAMTGGTMPLGITTFTCTAVDATCGGGDMASWTVEVNDSVSIDVSVQLSPQLASGNLTRCIDFAVYSDCVQAPLTFQEDLRFGGPGDLAGHFTKSLKLPATGAFACITAQDLLHTLRSCDFLACNGGRYSADFSGDPFFGGNWLTNGNLDAWSTVPGAGPDVINILDFGQYIAEFGNSTSADTLCGTAGPHADINGDGTVDVLDFAFVSMNFGANSIDCCCGAASASTGSLLTAVSVLELRQMGLGHIAVADLNRDGMVDLNDMNAFMSGQRPATKVRKTREGSGLRSR